MDPLPDAAKNLTLTDLYGYPEDPDQAMWDVVHRDMEEQRKLSPPLRRKVLAAKLNPVVREAAKFNSLFRQTS